MVCVGAECSDLIRIVAIGTNTISDVTMVQSISVFAVPSLSLSILDAPLLRAASRDLMYARGGGCCLSAVMGKSGNDLPPPYYA